MSRNIRKRGLGISAQRQRRKLGEGLSRGRHLTLECLEERRLLSLAPIISEVDPGNKTGIVDVLGNTADWLEIYNPDPTTAVNLSGWSVDLRKARRHDRQNLDVPQQRGSWSRRVPRGLLRLE